MRATTAASFRSSRSLLLLAGIAASLLVLIGAAPSAQAATKGKSAQIWVSPSGNDRAPGTQARPLRTLFAARTRARKQLLAGATDVNVRLLDGTYRLTRTLNFDSRDSGRGRNTVTWSAAKHARPEISGSIAVKNFALANPSLGIYRAKVPVGTRSRQLYVNGRRAVRARSANYPNGFSRTANGYEAPDESMAGWQRPTDLELVTLTQWKMMSCPVQSITGRQIAMQQPCWTNANVFPPIWAFNLISRFENALELLDEPGEWYLDSQEGWLYYMPRSGEKLSGSSVELPVVETLISGNGTATKPVRNLRFRGLTFAHATWLSPSGSDGYAADQSGFHLTGDGHQTSHTGHDPNVTRTPGNVRMIYAQNVSFVRNSFVRLGAVGLDFDTGSQSNTITGNRFEDISSAALQVGGVDIEDHHPPSPVQLTRDNSVTNNMVRSVGREFKDAAGIYIGFTTRSRVANNDVSNVPWSGIAIGWGWGLVDPGGFLGVPGATPGVWGNYTTPTASQGNRIEYNRVSNFLSTLWDGGGIYTVGQQGTSMADGEVIKGNVISGKRRLAGGNVIYTDGGSRYVTVVANVLYDNTPGITDFGPCGLADSLDICWLLFSYGTDRGGCRPYGDIAYYGNYWQHPKTFFEFCPYPPYPVNVTEYGNRQITGPSAISLNQLRRAGLQGNYRKRVGAG